MKLFSYKTEHQRRREVAEMYGKWHKWFAWFPIFDNCIERNDGVEKRTVYFYWLRYIERKIFVDFYGSTYYYREIEDNYQKTGDKYVS